MRLGGEVDDGVMAGQDVQQQLLVDDVPVDEAVARIGCDRRKVVEVARVRQLVVDGHGCVLVAGVAAGQQRSDVMRSDEARTTGDENAHAVSPPLLGNRDFAVVAEHESVCTRLLTRRRYLDFLTDQ